MIPCASPLAQYRAHDAVIRAAVVRVLEQGGYVLGREVEDFERAFADYCGTAHAVGVGNGTDALTLTLRAMEIGAGDEVITVSHTALATVAGVLASGARPVLVDIDPVYYTVDPAKVEAAITKKTRAVIAVHLYGQAADLPALQRICRRDKLKLIEDCAQSTGGFMGARRLGSMGDAGTFSFYPTKNLGAIGDGGMIVTANAALADRIRRLRQYGWNDKRETREVGVNSRLDPLQAAILGVKLPHLDGDNRRRAAIADQYSRALADLPLTLPQVRPDSRHVFHLYAMAGAGRDRLTAHLAAQGVQAGIHYPMPAHRHKGYADKVRLPKAGLPITMRLAKTTLSLPMYPELGDGDVARVIAAVRSHYEGRGRRAS
jgi:dTDP-4-amino-4,6-dideoxygalactose transaminase